MKIITLIKGLGLGVGAMYLFDPDMGRRRRALLRDQGIHASRLLSSFVDRGWRDLQNRVQGCLCETSSIFKHPYVSDSAIHDRVRAKLGHCVSNPKAISVSVNAGQVTLSGPIHRQELPGVLRCLSVMNGIVGVENHMDVHDDSRGISGLQGAIDMNSAVNWTPATRLVVGSTGAALIGMGLTKRFPVSCVLGTLGLAMCWTASATEQGGDGVEFSERQPIRAPRHQMASPNRESSAPERALAENPSPQTAFPTL